MITVEVLISLLILFLVIATSSMTIKHLIKVQQQQMRHEELYAAVISIRDWLDLHGLCSRVPELQGTLDGYDFSARCHLIKELKSYQYTFDEGQGKATEGNTGPWLMRLYQVNLSVGEGERSFDYHYEKSVAIDTTQAGS
jgi:hypothetical protein